METCVNLERATKPGGVCTETPWQNNDVNGSYKVYKDSEAPIFKRPFQDRRMVKIIFLIAYVSESNKNKFG